MSAKNNVISLQAYKQLKSNDVYDDPAYEAVIRRMTKLELLEEMVRFQEHRSKAGELSPKMMIRGRYLFSALEKNAETKELQSLTHSYRRHLEHEFEAYLERKKF